MLYQMDMFRSDEESELISMRKEIKKIKESTEKVRKSLFAKNGELAKKQYDLENRVEIIEKGLCHGK